MANSAFNATGLNIGGNFFTSDQAVTGSVDDSNMIFTTLNPYLGGTLEVFINGLRQARTTHVTETAPASGTFTLDVAPKTGDIIRVNYQTTTAQSQAADTVDGKHAAELSQVGDLIISLRATPGTNRLFMNGGTHAKASYPALWALNGSHPAYFSSSDATNFTLTDMSSRAPVGKSSSGTFSTIGNTMGSETHTLTTSEMPTHTHSLGTIVSNNAGSTGGYQREISKASYGTEYTGSSGSGNAHNNIQPSIVINYEVVAG